MLLAGAAITTATTGLLLILLLGFGKLLLLATFLIGGNYIYRVNNYITYIADSVFI